MSISRCSFKSVADLLLSWAGQDRTQLSATQLLQIYGYINSRLRDWAWIAWPWPELTDCEQRQYRLNYSGATAYTAPTASSASEVYDPPSSQYYQSLKATTGNAPTVLSNGNYVVNGAYWAVASGPYSGPDWLTATAYTGGSAGVAGTIVRDPADGLYKQCHTSHTSAGSTLDSSKFGILTKFDPYVSRTQAGQTAIGDFLGIFLDNPTTWPDPRRVPFRLDGLGAHVQTAPRGRQWQRGIVVETVPNLVYVKFRIPCPDFHGAVFDAGATYTAGSDYVYFAGSTTDLEGDFWLCAVNTSAGQSPQTTPASWTRLEFPNWLRTPVARRAFADWLRYCGQRVEARSEDASATDDLFTAQIQFGGMQSQPMKWRKSA